MNEKKLLTEKINITQIQALQFIEQFKFKLNSAVYWELDATWRTKDRIVDDSMFFIFFKGSAYVKIKEEEQLCSPGSIVFMPEGYEQTWWVDPKINKEIIELYCLHLDPLNAWNMNLFKLFTTMFIKIKNIDYWRERFIQYVALFNTNKELGQNTGNAFMKELLTAMIFQDFEIGSSKVSVDPRIIKVLEHIHEKYNQDITVEELADISRLSSAQLRKIFYQELQVNPKEYIYTYRLKQSMEMLKYSNLTIKEISYKIGFNNDHYFHNLFKKNFNITPSEFRKKGIKETVI